MLCPAAPSVAGPSAAADIGFEQLHGNLTRALGRLAQEIAERWAEEAHPARQDHADQDRLLKPRNFGEDYFVELEIEGKQAELEYQRMEATEDKPYEPQIFLLSSGEIAPPFNATLRQSFNDELLMLSVSSEGKIEIKADDI